MVLPSGFRASAAVPFQNLAAEIALLAEADSGEVLYPPAGPRSGSIHNTHPADGLVKIMMLLVAVTAVDNKEADLNEIIEMTETAWSAIGAGRTTMGITPGEEMTLLDLMYCAYMGGASEACNMVAERIAGSVEAYIDMMNERAAELGCENTNFVNTHGQYNENQYTTAYDLYLIFKEAMKYELFTEISGIYRYTIEETNRSGPRNIVSSNSLLNQSGKYFFRYCLSGMTSATYEGGYSLVSFAESDGLSLISVVLGSDVVIHEDESTDIRSLTESRRLFEWGFSQFGWRTILSSSELVEKVPITHGAGADFVNVRPETSITLLLDKDVPPEAFIRSITIFSEANNEPLVAPINAGDVLGELTLSRGGAEIATVSLIANTSIDLHSFQYIRMQVLEVLSSEIARYIIIILSSLLFIYILLVVRYNIIRRKRFNRIREAKRKLADERRQLKED